ncbi:piggyBac transposable element-derived protein 4 [Trichonephila clavipes]|nr:piggyBac transposable element-derived protein 4 [Trichonephila clavipes]
MKGVDRFDETKEGYQVRRRNKSLDQLTIRKALARQLIDRYSSRKRKERPASFQEKKCVVPDDGRLASVGNHVPKMVSNDRRCRKFSGKGQEKRTCYMCAEYDVSLCITTCFSSFHGK